MLDLKGADLRAMRGRLEDVQFDDDLLSYLAFHRRRYKLLLELLGRLVREVEQARAREPVKILDVGPYLQTRLIRGAFEEAVVDSLGFGDARFPPRADERHYEFDLNDARDPACRPEIPEHDIVLLAEVLEHLYTSPALILRWLSGYLRKGGYMVVQTPNGCAIHKRLRVLAGRSAFPMVGVGSPGPADPGHIHEYTVDELIEIAEGAGLTVVEWTTANYFDAGKPRHRIFVALGPLMPRRLRDGMTFCFRAS